VKVGDKMKKLLLFIALVIVVALALVGYKYWFGKESGISFVTISINPEVELAVNAQDEVTDVIPINEDADVITSDLDLIGLDVDEASEKIVDAAVETGYIDEYENDNTVVVTTASDDESVRKTLEERIMTNLNNHLESKKVYAVLVAKGLGDDLKAEAQTYNVSNGKMLLIEEAVALNPDLSKEDLAALSVQDIQKKIKSYVKERHEALKESLTDLKAKWESEKKTLKQDYINKVKALRNSISEEQKAAFKNMTPAQREEAITNYLKNKKEQIKSDINAIKDELKSELKSDMSGYNYPVLKNNAETIKSNIKSRIQERRNNR
jgi:hypothetical protein